MLVKNHYNTREARKILDLASDAVVRQYIKQGYLEAVKIGRDWHISKRSLEERLKKQ